MSKKSVNTRRRQANGRFLPNKDKSSYMNLFKSRESKDKGASPSIDDSSVKSFLKKFMNNRVLDLYLKYLGVGTMTTATMVPLGLILSGGFIEKFIKKEPMGNINLNNLPILDNPLVGNFIKLAGLAALKFTPMTLIPLGIVMIIYNLSIKNLFIQKGGRLTIGSSIPINLVQKLDGIISGQNGAPLFEAYDLMGTDLQQACGNGGCTANNIAKPIPVYAQSENVTGFATNETPQENTVNEINVVSNESMNISPDYIPDTYTTPMMAGGSSFKSTLYSGGPVNNATMSESQFREFNTLDNVVDSASYAKDYSYSSPPIDYEPLFADIHGAPPKGIGQAVAMNGGGSRSYNFIVDPETKLKVSINSKDGQRILHNFVQVLKSQ